MISTQFLSRTLLFNTMKNKGIFILSLLFVLGVMATIVLSVIVLTIFIDTDVKRPPHIILILADDIGTNPIEKCKGKPNYQNIFIHRIQ